jgi:exonuclease SbcC
MIEYDYLIERDEGDETKEFKPDKIPTKLDNLSYIEGPNSSGKSTLLNIIALGFYGLKNSRINVALQDKLKSLSNSTHQKLSFKIKISSKNADLEIT